MNALSRNVSLRLGLLLAAALAVIASRPAAAGAAAPVASLDVVPADAAFYSATLRNREQLQTIANSKAWAKIKRLPFYQMGMAMYQMQAANPETPLGQYQAMLENEEFRKSVDFVGDLLSDEVFVYGGPNFKKIVDLYQTVYGAVQLSAFQAAAGSGALRGTPPSNAKMEEVQGRAFVQALVSQIENIEVPELVIGLKVKDKKFAKQLLDRLEPNLRQAFAVNPMFEGRLKRTKVAGHSYLTLSLDGGMIPWDQEVLNKIRSLAATPADGDKLIERLKNVKLVISLGLREEFLLVAIGPSTDVLKRLGGPQPLRSRAELAAVKKFADKRIVSVSYSSKAFNDLFSPSKDAIEQLAAYVKGLLPSLPAPDKLREDLAKSTDELAKDLKSMVTEIGATASVAFRTDTGYESYGYDWSDYPEIDCSRPLDLLKHIGGNPIAVFVSRSKVSPEGYDTLVKWFGIGGRYFREHALPQIPAEARAPIGELLTKAQPLLKRLDMATRDLLIPALADGQAAVVLDAKLTSRQFLKALPATEQPLPMIEPAIVLAVSDAAKLRAAFVEYYDVADDFIELIKRIDKKQKKPDFPQDFKIPRPREFNLRQGKVYGYALPAAAGVDNRVMPNAGLSEKVAVLSLSGRHSQRLMRATEPTMAGIKLPTGEPCGAVAALDFAALVNAVTPWVNLALEQAAADTAAENAENIKLHVKTALKVLKCYRGTVSTTCQEGKATVTRTRSVYGDLAE